MTRTLLLAAALALVCVPAQAGEPATMPALQEYRQYNGAMPLCWRAEQVVALLAAYEEGGEVLLSRHGCMGEPDATFRLTERITEIDVRREGMTYRVVIFRAVVLGIRGDVVTFFSYRLEQP